jgi:hypothetical protein
MAYNNTFHSEIKTSPSQYLLENIHNSTNSLPLDSDTIENWKVGHPNFAPFRLNQLVAHSVQKIGNRLEYKLGKIFKGPFKIIKIQSTT